ncbi:MAG: hypothetical protein NWT08_15160 [Akkermansiaceae bacterium]|jgi:hypothetical protein|nr:hypothetical protein [Akkermansiaceae bacterium]MDP4646552.1 hypothetical protein [Akkermansiaceae bacterium]MDP4719643.1 hypothetical protein [Akkermansiaceae bacterium]MDP4781106.1 hypothetical protein [Akkermansiaceae bacterium]MDP4846451.1 hypothetical protein [Akkermansiaceae bacterium]
MKTHFILPLTLIILPCQAADPVFIEDKGVVVMEAESTDSKLGKWKKKTDVEGFTGECHIEFTGNKPESGPAESPLTYKFKITKEGTYSLVIRARKRLETKREDISNDCYVALKGDFESTGKTPMKLLENDTKLFGGTAEGWGWTAKLDDGHKKFPAEYKLKSGETYELTVSGRSKNFNIDRIMLVHDSENMNKVRNSLPEESEKED